MIDRGEEIKHPTAADESIVVCAEEPNPDLVASHRPDAAPTEVKSSRTESRASCTSITTEETSPETETIVSGGVDISGAPESGRNEVDRRKYSNKEKWISGGLS